MVLKNPRIIIAIVIAVLLCWPGGDIHAGGYMIPHQTARGLGLSNALTAGVNDPSAVYYNPAALGQVDGNNLQLNGIYINVSNSVENSGRRATNKHDDNFLPSLFANYHLPNTGFSFGIGAYTPFGLATNYESDFVRFAAQRTELKTLYVTPAVSWQATEYLSVGAGLSFVHASGLFSRGLCLDPVTSCTAPIGLEGRVRLTDTDNAFGYNLGLLVKPFDHIKLGFSYRSRVDLRFDNADAKFGGSFSIPTTRARLRPIPLPAVMNTGLFWQITPNWGAELVHEYTRWSEFQNFTATFSPAPTFVPLGVPITGFRLPQDWKNTHTLRFGSSFAPSRNWELRGGIAVEESPVPSRTLNPSIPSADLLTLNAGIGYKWERLSLDAGYMAVFYKTRRVNNDQLEGLPATSPLGFGGAPGRDKYETFNNFVTVSIGYRF